MIVWTARIEVPDDMPQLDVEERKLHAEWHIEEAKLSLAERMRKTDLEGKCGSCKYFELKPLLYSCVYGDCLNGHAGFRQRTVKACKDYERRDE